MCNKRLNKIGSTDDGKKKNTVKPKTAQTSRDKKVIADTPQRSV